ncbi:hypothetical protein AWB64_00953 [Caballeronia sordidicola]|uniref:Uncharacterized protein n=1 Tax=Caballeronia sordidicola TaxID=196367 RepID=A0A158F8M7_CABSO|nr:hypothetical protein [Caballeronia sordidicola]SAL16216.1 hypothetical protein AWB64_00953 [Caballeronia sordidicola]
MGLFSIVGSAFRAAKDFVVNEVINPVIRKAKEVTGKVVIFLADEAEHAVAEIKKVWTVVKPWLVKARDAAAAAALTIPHPEVRAAAAAVAKVLDFVSTIDEHPLAKRIAAAIEWAIKMAKEARRHYQTQEEIDAAEAYKEVLAKAKEMAPEELQRGVKIAEFINNSILLRTRIDELLNDSVIEDIDHYLRLRAAQRLLANAEKKIRKLSDIEKISDNDMFLIQVSTNLLDENPQLSDVDAARLEKIVQKRYGKPLIAFVFEEMVVAWGNDLKAERDQQTGKEGALAKNKVQMKKLELSDKMNLLGEAEQATLKSLRAQVKQLDEEIIEDRSRNSEFQILIQAAEGFLQIIEKDEARLEAEDLSWLAESAVSVGKIVIDCVQSKKRFSDLPEAELSLINDFSNIFAAASKARAEQLVMVAG